MDIPPKIKDTAISSEETDARLGTKWFGGPLTDLSRISIPFFWSMLLGCLCIMVFGGFVQDRASGLREIARWLLTAGGMLISGGATGFLFAIPRTLQREQEAKTSRSGLVNSSVGKENDHVRQDASSSITALARYSVNSNLEQISDWLTKIIVGVGLTQLHNLPSVAARAATFFAGGPNSDPLNRAFALGVILYFGIVGFVAGYLLTRVYLTGAFVRADIDNDRLS